MTGTKLELTWPGKNKAFELEPRILIEKPELSYGDSNTENMLIHGDNLLALKALEQEYTGRIKCIYIDPPYNTGAAFECYDDGLEHSERLSLMRPRLEMLCNLLSNEGIIYTQIDDYEQGYLRVLMDEIFGRENFIACLPCVMNLKGNQDQFGFAGTHEYIMVYAKDKSRLSIGQFVVDEDEIDGRLIDDIGYYKQGATLKRTGQDAPRKNRPYGYFPILVNNITREVSTIQQDEYKNIYNSSTKSFNDVYVDELKDKYEKKGYSFLLPTIDGEPTSWRWGYDKVKNENYDIIVTGDIGKFSLYKKQRPEIGDLPTKKPKSLFYKPEYSSGNGKAQLKALGIDGFSYPKPENLIYDILYISSNPGDIVLDSFLGSGTTAAVAHKMGRKWIGIELGDHAYTHCKKRLDMVVDGEQGGVSKIANRQGGGGYKFYELGPSVLLQDKYGNYIINPNFKASELIQALCKIENFTYKAFEDNIKHGYSTEKDFIHVTTRHITQEIIKDIQETSLKEGETMLIVAKTFESNLDLPDNIQIKKIPAEILNKCEYNKDDYSLPITKEEIADED